MDKYINGDRETWRHGDIEIGAMEIKRHGHRDMETSNGKQNRSLDNFL
jgi:hypothetical protein